MTMEIRCLESAACNQSILDLFCNQLLAKSQFLVLLGLKCLFELFQGYLGVINYDRNVSFQKMR